MPLAATVAPAADDQNIRQGMPKCDVEGGGGLLLGSKKNMTCMFKMEDGTETHQTGNDVTIGVDIGVTQRSRITWAVTAPSGR